MRYELDKLKTHPDYHRVVFNGRVSPCGRFVDYDAEVDGLAPAPEEVKREHVPGWAFALSQLRSSGDRGVGDTAARVFGAFGGELFKAAFKARFGFDCGCAKRQDDWNLRWPYGD